MRRKFGDINPISGCFSKNYGMLPPISRVFICKTRPRLMLMEEWDKLLEREDESAALWKELSQMWVHARGVMEGITNRIVQQTAAPAWGIVLPQAYAMGDMTALDELKERLSQFRSLLRDAMSHTGP
jgi:hypothetical protein